MNDNLFKNAMVLFVVYNVYSDPKQEEQFSAIASTLFVIPFFLLSAVAGQLADARDKTPVEEAVRSTDGFSFAELDELKKLLVLRYLDTEAWDWSWARHEFARRSDGSRDQPRIGFAAATAPRTKRSHESKAQA